MKPESPCSHVWTKLPADCCFSEKTKTKDAELSLKVYNTGNKQQSQKHQEPTVH